MIFDSAGMALQDVIAASTVYKKAVDKGIGRTLDVAQ
jgi:ornithine cyclodeaminase/alanine dehydrogenase-like protein (mu-crystallin family)